MKKLIVMILSFALALSLSVCAFATESFDPTLKIETSADGTTITVTMNDLPTDVSAELTIPCDGWDGAMVKDSSDKTVTATFDKTADTVTFAAVGGTYTITKETNSGTSGSTGGNTSTGGTSTGGNSSGGTGGIIGGGTTTGGTGGTTTTTTTTEASKTFDSGIVLYGAMAVLAATGSAVVIGKKRK